MISSPNRHSPIGIAARRFGFFSAGALTAMTSVYCRRCTELAQLHLWRRPFRHLKSENEHCVIPYPLTKLPSSAFGNSTCHMPPVDIVLRTPGRGRYRAPRCRTASCQPAAERRATRPHARPAAGRATIHRRRDVAGSESDTHAMPMVHAWNHYNDYCAVTAVFSVHHT